MKEHLSQALQERGYDTLTPVQEAVTNPELTGADLLVSAQTGSGKTLGFGLAIAPTILRDAEVFEPAAAPLALVIAPTRELAMQVKRELGWLYAKTGASMASCVGGMDMRDERRALARGAHIVVATPGRLRDHVMRESIDLSALRAVVLDEADEMLDLGFREDLEFILGETPQDRQTLLFSATVPPSIATLAGKYQKDAIRVDTKSEHSQHADIAYQALTVSDRDAENAIINVLRFHEAPNAIVFANTRATVNRLTSRLSNRGFSVVSLSGELSQSERTHALQAMRDGRARVCVATDVAARGIDLPNLDLVIHAELPSSHETLLHRSGRTGRAGRKGVSTLIVGPKVRKKAERILKFAKLQAEWTQAPSADAVRARDEERMLADPSWHDDVTDSERGTVDALAGRFSPEQLAAAYLRLYQSRHSAPEELKGVDEAPKPRAPFGPSVWFSVSTGRNQNAEPRRLLPMLCKAGDITKDAIGAIRVQADESFVELRQADVAGFLAAVGPDMTLEAGAVLTQLDSAPDLPSGPRPGSSGPKGRHTGPKRPHRGADRPDRGNRPDRPERTNRPDRPERSERSERPIRSDRPDRPERSPRGGDRPQRDANTKGTTKPVDWNDAPSPRARKPKPGDKPAPRSHKANKPPQEPSALSTGAVTTLSVKRATKPSGKPKRAKTPDGKPKGPPPPKGKPSSKKNKARAEALKAAKGVKGKQGGGAPPRRKP